MPAPVRLEPRGDRPAPLRFKEGGHAPFGIRWYGATSLWGHFRNFVSTAVARESVDARDWMRPLDADEMLANVLGVLGLENKGTLLESLEGPLWIDWVADTGDDRDVSQEVGRMVFAEYAVDDDGAPLTLPRGDVLLFGGDTAYPVATSEEIYRRLLEPWNEVLGGIDDPRERPRVLLGIPGNHDWYDGLDGFGRLFRRRVDAEPSAYSDAPLREGTRPSLLLGRKVGLIARGLHLDEAIGAIDTAASVAKAARAFWKGQNVAHRRYLALDGYEPVQESSYWALPLAPGLDLWGTDRQLGRVDYRQRAYFERRREAAGGALGIWLVAPDPAIAFGERWEFGERILTACDLSLERDRVLFQCGDMHHYERRVVGESMHVIAGGGGAFLHGTRIIPDPKPAAAAYPSAKATRRLALQVPFKLMFGRSGYLVHMGAAAVAALELVVGWHDRLRYALALLPASAAIIWALYAIAGHQRAHPRRVLALAVPFGAALGLLPMGLAVGLRLVRHSLRDIAGPLALLGSQPVLVILYAYLAALLYGVFLALCGLQGLEMQQVFTVLGHPGFKHFVRMRVSPDGTIDAWAIGKDDPLARDGPWLVDRWTWKAKG